MEPQLDQAKLPSNQGHLPQQHQLLASPAFPQAAAEHIADRGPSNVQEDQQQVPDLTGQNNAI